MRLLRRTCCALIAFCIPLTAAIAANDGSSPEYDGPKDKLHIYLLIGDALMEDGAETSKEPGQVIDRCYLLNKKGKWEPAKGRLNRYSTVAAENDTHDFAPAYSFAKAMLKKDKTISIGLIVNAGTNSRIEDWHGKSDYYRGARGRTKKALRSGTLKGILWHHGMDSFNTTRIDNLKDLVAYLRVDLDDLNLPFIVGEIPGSTFVNNIYAAFSDDVHATAIASADGFKTSAKGILDEESQKTLGERYAKEVLSVQAKVAAREKSRLTWDIPLIDTHVHASSNKKNGLDVAAKWMNKNNIERIVTHALTPTRPVGEEQRKIMRANFQKYKGKIYRFCIIEPDEVNTVEEAVAILKKEKADGAIGFGEHYGRNMMFDDPKNMCLYAACEKVGLPIMFHIDQNKNMDAKNFPHLRNALQTYPKCIFIAHAQWWMQLPSGVCDRMLQEYPNLYADPSGRGMAALLNRDRKYTEKFLIRNADKIMYGNDDGWWSIKDAKQEQLLFTVLEELDLPQDVRTKIYRGNAEKLFGFTDDTKPTE